MKIQKNNKELGFSERKLIGKERTKNEQANGDEWTIKSEQGDKIIIIFKNGTFQTWTLGGRTPCLGSGLAMAICMFIITHRLSFNLLQSGDKLPRVNQDTRLNLRVLDIRTPANQGIFCIQCQVGTIFRQFLLFEGFIEIHTPKLIAGSSEGGYAVFKLDYKGQPACLAQSPQLHKQMAICGDFGWVF
ncbi:aspartate--tRNA ligase 1, cytoplasmic-like [Hibiscus syriacus]|uniref:aspartate--tRNA ligase 1, cytoplasmic-like n=1 Tax=Hibiscus syriacus TaxID=106335 RepID=UPI0019237038|nr:aspartate--tRNA ligase 1, cytoplasmic-like [Hibiscus syriacus]